MKVFKRVKDIEVTSGVFYVGSTFRNIGRDGYAETHKLYVLTWKETDVLQLVSVNYGRNKHDYVRVLQPFVTLEQLNMLSVFDLEVVKHISTEVEYQESLGLL